MSGDFKTRLDNYFGLSSRLAQADHTQLLAPHIAHKDTTGGWGTHHTIKLGRQKLFVKRLPLTECERVHMLSTSNLYDLPTSYNYGVGSVGFGVFRELVTHIKTTNWVLTDAIRNFPLLYHYRIVPRTGDFAAVDSARHQRYVAYWNGNLQIAQYVLDRQQAPYELALFLEHIPYAFGAWLGKNIGQLDRVVAELRDTIGFLRQKGIIHFDVHFDNIVTDGRTPYLTDFGLVLDRQFALNDSERAFYKRNRYYDYGQLLVSIGWHLASIFASLSPAKKERIRQQFGIDEDLPSQPRTVILLEHIEELYQDGVMKLDRNFVEMVVKYRDVIMMMQSFFGELQRNARKDTTYSQSRLRRLLHESGFLD